MKAIVIGLGQDGRLMSELMLQKGIDFRVIIRRSSNSVYLGRESGIPEDHIVSLSSFTSDALYFLQQKFPFTHIFNFAANTFVQDSGHFFEDYINHNSGLTWEILKLLERCPDLWIMQPLSSEILSDTPQDYADLTRCMAPRNAYGLSKLVDLYSCEIERKTSKAKILSPIMFNHESRYRPPQFFTRKVLNYLNQRHQPEAGKLYIFNCKSIRDWGSAPEYIEMLLDAAENKISGTPIMGTGHAMSVETFVDSAFKALSIPVSKSLCNGLLSWKSEAFSIIEKQRDLDDEARIVVANKDMVKEFFGKTPSAFGSNLVEQLANDEI